MATVLRAVTRLRPVRNQAEGRLDLVITGARLEGGWWDRAC